MRERTVKSIDEILEISFRYLTEHGLENTSIRDIAGETEMSLGSIYYWFESKDDLIINAVKYGLAKSSSKIFKNSFETIETLESFLANVMNLVTEEQKSLRIVFQAATSPTYGSAIRDSSTTINGTYDEYIEHLSQVTGVQYDELRPIVYLFIATILDYVVWDDYAFSKSQIEYIYGILQTKIEKKEN